MGRAWRTLGTVAPDRLIEPRTQLHYAINALMSVGRAYAQPEPDYGHASFQWLTGRDGRPPGPGVLAGRLVHGDRSFRAALRLDRPSVLLLDAEDGWIAERTLDGRTLPGLVDWLSVQIEALGLDPSELVLKLPKVITPHPVGDGRAFVFDDLDACAELAAWYDDADALIREVAEVEPRATAVRCWPHHFDLASLVKLTDRTDNDAPCVGVGLSPGDQRIGEPYLYVSPWPYPPLRALPPASPGARWRTEDWVGLYLTASELVAGGESEGQPSRARGFLGDGIADATKLLGPVVAASGGR